MVPSSRFVRWSLILTTLAALTGLAIVAGCASGGNTWEAFGSVFTPSGTSSGSTGPSSTGTTQGTTSTSGSDRTPVDPCTESQARRFVTISMRNLTQDYVHYFLVAVAFVAVDTTAATPVVPTFDGTPFPNGAVCAANIALYTQFGYQQIASGQALEFGDYCISGPALVYFHRAGQFRRSAGTGNSSLGSAIAPAQGSSPTYDNFFTSTGTQVPVPDLILFHNPGSGEGAQLKISIPNPTPCAFVTLNAAAPCLRDAFYYVDENDLMVGSTALGQGSGRRVPAEIQGTGCVCTGASLAYAILAPSHVTARNTQCNEFLRGGRIDFAFLRQDENPPFPQLVWKVTDSSGASAHDFDSRSGLAP